MPSQPEQPTLKPAPTLTPKKPLRGLYAISDEQLLAEDVFADRVATVLQAGCRIIQYRNKQGSLALRQEQAAQLRKLCTQYDACLLINDDVELAVVCQADGVHLGQGDTSLKAARKRLGEAAIIGITCHNSLPLALDAEAAGASYVAFGSCFPSPTKPEARRADLALLQQARQALRLPIVAIGGITRDNATPLLNAGVDMLAVISDLFAENPASTLEQRTHEFIDLFSRNGNTGTR